MLRLAACTRAIQSSAVTGHARAEAYAYRADYYLERRNISAAIADYSSAADTEPQSWVYRVLRCHARAVANVEPNAAIADCNEAMRLSPTDAMAYFYRAVIRARRGEWNAAEADCNEALARTRNPAMYLYLRGIARMRLGRAALGQADIDAAIQRDPGAPRHMQEQYDLAP